MRTHQRLFSSVALALSCVLSSAHIAQAQPPRSVSPPASGERVLRSWQDTVKVGGGDQVRIVEIIYDYDAGVALRRTTDADGTLLREQILGAQPQPSREEIEQAIAVVRNDRALGPLSRQVRAHFDGGFILDEAKGRPCGPGTRCIQVFMLSESRWGLLRRSAVDLRSGRIAHRNFRLAD